jgi:hypothetical protein
MNNQAALRRPVFPASPAEIFHGCFINRHKLSDSSSYFLSPLMRTLRTELCFKPVAVAISEIKKPLLGDAVK